MTLSTGGRQILIHGLALVRLIDINAAEVQKPDSFY